MFIRFNPNPKRKEVGDCTIRAISAATGESWRSVFVMVVNEAYSQCDMPSSNEVWSALLNRLGFKMYRLKDECPMCYTVKDFCEDHPNGTYVLGTGTHVVCVKNGNYYDAWDSGNKVPIYYFIKENQDG